MGKQRPGWGFDHVAFLVAVLMAAILTACSSSLIPTTSPPSPPASGDLIWPVPGNPMELTVKAGLQPENKETLAFHVHAHLDVLIEGRPIMVPPGIGINVMDTAVKHGKWNGQPTFGGIAGCLQPCISPLHTHYASGVIHTESGSSTPHRLGQLFTEWDVPLTDTCIGQYCRPATSIVVYVDGQRYSGRVADITLTDRKEIAIIIGSAPKEIPSSFPSWAIG
ncbi:MAG: hypothetical protein M3082_08770 [Candidatus Dormibacteraeota bacterium]|nr:hypothetical protein [Candidatus Dormibacteraeota bacterium]